MSHSPAPWKFGIVIGREENDWEERFEEKPFDYHGPGYIHNPKIFDANGGQIAGCDEYNVFNFDDHTPAGIQRRMANVRLMVAAPFLLAELKRLVLRCDGAEGVRADGSNIDTCAAHAAIEAAEGDSP